MSEDVFFEEIDCPLFIIESRLIECVSLCRYLGNSLQKLSIIIHYSYFRKAINSLRNKNKLRFAYLLKSRDALLLIKECCT